MKVENYLNGTIVNTLNFNELFYPIIEMVKRKIEKSVREAASVEMDRIVAEEVTKLFLQIENLVRVADTGNEIRITIYKNLKEPKP